MLLAKNPFSELSDFPKPADSFLVFVDTRTAWECSLDELQTTFRDVMLTAHGPITISEARA